MTVIHSGLKKRSRHSNIPSISAAGDPVRLYDKDAKPVKDLSEDKWHMSDSIHMIVQGVVKDASYCMQMNHMLSQGRVLVMASDKGLVLQQKDDGNIVFYSVLPYSAPVDNISSAESLRLMLKTTFAGWHHAFHEVFAMAHAFTLKIIGNSAIEKLVRVG